VTVLVSSTVKLRRAEIALGRRVAGSCGKFGVSGDQMSKKREERGE